MINKVSAWPMDALRAGEKGIILREKNENTPRGEKKQKKKKKSEMTFVGSQSPFALSVFRFFRPP